MTAPPSNPKEHGMLTSNIKTARNDIKTLLQDARELFREASLVTGEHAEELRAKGMEMLDVALERGQALQAVAVEKGKVAARQTDEYVRGHPWQAVAASAGAGLLIGLLCARR